MFCFDLLFAVVVGVDVAAACKPGLVVVCGGGKQAQESGFVEDCLACWQVPSHRRRTR